MRQLLKDETDNGYQKVITKSDNCLLQNACEKVKHELRVTSINPRVTSSNPRVTSSNLQVTSSNLGLASSNIRVAS